MSCFSRHWADSCPSRLSPLGQLPAPAGVDKGVRHPTSFLVLAVCASYSANTYDAVLADLSFPVIATVRPTATTMRMMPKIGR